MALRGRAAVRVLVLLTCTALVSLGCSRAPATDAGSVVPDRDSVIRTEDDGPVVSIPSGSVSGPGQVRVEPVTAVDGARGWSIELDGAQLVGRATIRFPLSGLEPDEPAPLVTYSETIDGQRILAPDVVRDGDDLVVTTGHFSFWWTEKLSTVRDATTQWLRQKYDGLAGAGNGTQPDCPGEQSVRDAGYDITSDDGNRVYWCFGTDGDTPVLKAVNARGYAVAVEYTPGLNVERTDRRGLLDHAAELLRPPPAGRGNSVELVPSGGGIDFSVTGGGGRTVGMMVTPNAGAYLLTALAFAADTYTMVLDRVGARDAAGTLLSTLQGEQCLVAFSELAVTDIAGPGDAARFFEKALGMAMSCAGTALSNADLGPVLSTVVAPVLWIVNGVRTAAVGVTGAIDSLDTTGYRVVVTKPVRDTEVVAVSAVDSSGEPLPGWTPQNPARTVIDCRYPYPAASSTGIDIVQCGSTVDGAHTCWIADDRRSLTCAIDVWDEKFLQYRVASPLAPVPAATDPQPEWIELDDGTRCSMRHGGAWGGRADGLVGMYSCSGTSSVVLTGRDGPGIDRSTPKWTVEVGELGDPDEQFPPPTTRGVVRAYFAASGDS